MCKIIIIPNASKIKDFNTFSRFAAEILSSMPDGYGFAAQGSKGVFGARTLSPLAYAKSKVAPSFCEGGEESFGVQSKVIGAAMFHGRMSTNVTDLVNTHPIVRNKWHLIHNGVVTHHGEKYSMNTANDSEHVLYNLMNGGIEAMGKNLTGYYAGGAIDDTGMLHVFRDAIAKLYYADSVKLQSPIFATTIELIEEIGEHIGEEMVIFTVKDNSYVVYNNGKLVEEKTFKSRGYDDHSKSLAKKSLGYDFKDKYMDELDNYGRFEDAPCHTDSYDMLDDSYTYHFGLKEITCEEFFALDYYDQQDCVVAKNGEIVDIRWLQSA